MRYRMGLLLIVLSMLLSACASPEARIRQYPQIYARATPKQQLLISRGQIALGFSPAFVRLALGRPDRVTEHTDSKGTEVIWHYVTYNVYPYYYSPYWYGLWPPVVVQPPVSEHDWLRVVFRNGRVISIDRQVG